LPLAELVKKAITKKQAVQHSEDEAPSQAFLEREEGILNCHCSFL
jgi:hypothetical protein